MADLADIAALRWPRRTARLAIRPATAEDLEAVWWIRRQEAVHRWMPREYQDLDGFVELMTDPDRLGKTLVIEHDGTLIGDLMLAPEDGWAQSEVADRARGVHGEIGWCLNPAYAGRGLATEAVRELIGIAFEELGLRRLVANCFAANEPSWRLMERVGMRREAYNVRESLHRSGEWMDGVTYALLADEWSGVGSGAAESSAATTP